jgi:molybdopterin-guanine dinucleotide biosynthesis protein A
MGSSKADLRLGERSLLEWVFEGLQGLFQEILLAATNPPRTMPKGCRLAADEPPGGGPLGGLYAGLRASREEMNFAVGCDMPFVRPRLVEGLLAMAREDGECQVLVPRTEDGLHPLCGVYSRACLESMGLALEKGERRLTSFFPSVKARFIGAEDLREFDPELISLFNINTPEDLLLAEQLRDKFSRPKIEG